MQLRQRLSLVAQTLSEFVLAAEEKYWEALELATAGRPAASIYLLGYTAEMLLKVAAFRFDGATPADLVEPRLVPARVWLRAHAWHIPHEGYHSVAFWATYLRARRATRGMPLERNLDGQLVHHVRRIYAVWWVEMRYVVNRTTAGDVERLMSDVSWLRDNFTRLWR
jgi:hypothetical protein